MGSDCISVDPHNDCLHPWFGYGGHWKGWLRSGCPEDGLEDGKHGLDTPEAQRQYFEYALKGAGLAKRYLKGEASLHVHLCRVPLLGEGRVEAACGDLCVVFQRSVRRAPSEAFEVCGCECVDAGTAEHVDGCPCGVRDSVLVDVVEAGESVERAWEARRSWQPGVRDAPNGAVPLVEGLQLLDACEVAAEHRLLAHLARRRRELFASGGECRIPVRVVGVGAVDGELDVLALDRGGVFSGCDCPEADEGVVERGARVVDAVSDDESPVGVRLLKVVDAERILASICVDADVDSVRVALLEGLDLRPENLEVVRGPPQLLKGIVESGSVHIS